MVYELNLKVIKKKTKIFQDPTKPVIKDFICLFVLFLHPFV